MAPVHASKEDNKVVIRFSTWLVPVLIALGSFVFGFIVKDARADEQVKHVEQRLSAVEALEKEQRPARELVTQDQFKEVIYRIDSNISDIKDSIKRVEVKQDRARQ